MSRLPVEEDLRMLYFVVKLTGARPSIDDLAEQMGLKNAATSKRFSLLMKRLQTEFGDVDNGRVNSRSTKKPVVSTSRKHNNNGSMDEERAKKKPRMEPDDFSEDEDEDGDEKPSKDESSGGGDEFDDSGDEA